MKSLMMMTATSPCHMVPDTTVESCLNDIEDSFYSQVMSTALGPNAQQQMVSSSSDTASECSETEDKVYMSLSGHGVRKAWARSPLAPLPQDRYLSAENINIKSWRERHPKHWGTQDIINWIYFVCSRSERLDCYSVRGESFNTLKGDQLCRMTREQFIVLDPNYGADLHDCFQKLLRKADFKAPPLIEICPADETIICPSTLSKHPFPITDGSAMWSSTVRQDESDHEMDLGVCSSTFISFDHGCHRLNDLDPIGPGTGIAIIGNNHYDYKSDDGFDDIPPCGDLGGESSGYGSDGSSCGSSGVYNQTPPPAHSNHAFSFPPPHPIPQSPQDLRQQQPSHIPETVTYASMYTRPYAPTFSQTPTTNLTATSAMITTATPTVKATTPVKQRGRPKRDGVPGQRGRKQGQTTKGNHLWEFIRDTINDRRYNPDYIKWENKEQGIFRIVNSAEIAKMWGRTKNNSSMTYEKFSRAMRFCRTQEFFADLPKEGNYPKKLCFRFGAKATHWKQ